MHKLTTLFLNLITIKLEILPLYCDITTCIWASICKPINFLEVSRITGFLWPLPFVLMIIDVGLGGFYNKPSEVS